MVSLLFRFCLLLLLGLGAGSPLAWAQGPGQRWVYLLNPSNGQATALIKLDGGKNRSQAQPEDLVRHPFLNALATVPDTVGPVSHLPTRYQNQDVVACPWRITPKAGVFTFLSYGKSSDPLHHDGPGVFAVIDQASGAIRWVLPFSFTQGGAVGPPTGSPWFPSGSRLPWWKRGKGWWPLM